MTATGVLLMSHGTPRSLDDLPGFYTEIRRGRPPPAELLADLERRYRAIGGLSPLNAITDAQADCIRHSIDARAPGRFVVASGAKFASPRIEDAVACLARADVARIVGVVLAPHHSAASVGEYARRARAAAARSASEGRGPSIDVVPHWHLAPGLVALLATRVHDACSALPRSARHDPAVVFTAHSIPTSLVEAGDPYPTQVEESARAVAEAAGVAHWSVAWQSAGRTTETWLGPDVRDVVVTLARHGASSVVVCPIGFVSDHLEVLYDLDIELRAVAEGAGLAMTRTVSLNDDPVFCDVVAGVVLDAADAAA